MRKLIKMDSPLKKGEIEYNKYIADSFGVYSIDRFTFNFRLSETLYESLKFSLETWTWRFGNTDVQRFETKRFGEKVDVMQFGKLHIEFWKNETLCCMKLDFSPNHCKGHKVLNEIFSALNRTEQTFTFDLSRVDFAYDIPLSLSAVYVLSRKTEGYVGTTRYYGKRGSNGMLRVYNKRAEEALNRHVELGSDITRLEWEQRGGKDLSFTFDKFCTADFLGLQFPASVIPFIEPQNINKAFKSMSKNTRTSYRKLFTPYPFVPENFLFLLHEYFADFGIFSDRWNYSENCCASDLALRSDFCTVTFLDSLVTMNCEDE